MMFNHFEISIVLLTCGLSVHSIVELKGEKVKQNDGSNFLFFTCESHSSALTHYVEFLVNNKSEASSTYYFESGHCDFKHDEIQCKNMCNCSSDGRLFSWTFPMPPSISNTLYSCHMFVNNQKNPEQDSLLYNGTDFVRKIAEERNSPPPTSQTPDIVGGDDNKESEQSSITVVYVLITVLFVVLAFLGGFVIYKEVTKRKIALGESCTPCAINENSGSSDRNKEHQRSEQLPLLIVTSNTGTNQEQTDTSKTQLLGVQSDEKDLRRRSYGKDGE